VVTAVPLRSRTPSRRLPSLTVALVTFAASASVLTGTASAASRHRATTRRHHATPACAGAHRRVSASHPAALRAAVVCLINQQRTERGLPALQANVDLDHSAQRWTQVMVTTHEFTHGSDFARRIAAAGFRWSQAGENIATGYRTPSSVVRGWMASTGHCENILDPGYRAVGTGVSAGAAVPSDPGTWTQDFGLRMGQRPASRDGAPAAGCPYG
jgi:uncharacterized protein YkwD